MNRNTKRRFAAGLGAVIAGAGATVLIPTAAQAAEGVQSSYNVGCTLYPDDASGSSEQPEGVAHDGPRNDVTASPLLHEITAGASARFSPSVDGPGFREDCFAGTDYSDRLTVGAGTSGLSEGSEVGVAITIHVRGSLDEIWGSGASFSTLAEYRAEAALVSVDDCTTTGGGLFGGGESVTVCEEPMRFSLERDRTVYGTAPGTWDANGSVDLYYSHSHELVADGVVVSEDDAYEEILACGAFPPDCNLLEAPIVVPNPGETFTATATLVVGRTYRLSGDVSVGTSAGYAQNSAGDVPLSATAALDEFALDITSSSGIDLAFASAGAPDDTTAPTVAAEISPAPVGGWNTTTATVTLSATDDGSGVESITYSSTGAVTTPQTVVPGDTATLSIDADGITELTYVASDAAGNVSGPQSLSVRRDTSAPAITGADDVTVQADGPDGALVTFPAAATDNLAGPVALACDPPSGSAFPAGQTTVTCTAADQAGNTSEVQFVVTVTAPDPMVSLGDALAEIAVPGGIRNALQSKYDAAVARFEAGDTGAGCGALRALGNHVSAQTGKKISSSDAAMLQTTIRDARAANGC